MLKYIIPSVSGLLLLVLVGIPTCADMHREYYIHSMAEKLHNFNNEELTEYRMDNTIYLKQEIYDYYNHVYKKPGRPPNR